MLFQRLPHTQATHRQLSLCCSNAKDQKPELYSVSARKSAEIGTASDQIFGYGGFLKWCYPTNPWVFFLLKMSLLGCEMGIPPFKETHIWLDDGGQKRHKQIKRPDP